MSELTSVAKEMGAMMSKKFLNEDLGNSPTHEECVSYNMGVIRGMSITHQEMSVALQNKCSGVKDNDTLS